jgi:hypothetical protein
MRTITTYRKSGRLLILRVIAILTSIEGNCTQIRLDKLVVRSRVGARHGSIRWPGASSLPSIYGWQHELLLEFAWRESDVVHPKTVGDRKDLQSFSMHLGTPITPVTRRPVSGSLTMFLNPSLQPKSTDGYAAVQNIEPDTSRTLRLKTAKPPSPEHSAGAS